MRCTWVNPKEEGNCLEQGTVERKDNDGKVWANLCTKHANQLEEAEAVVLSGKAVTKDIARFMAYWVRAQGGAQAAAKRMVTK